MKKIYLFVLLLFVHNSVFASSCEYSEPVNKFIWGKTIDTIGDSITFLVNEKKSLRCLMRDHGLKYDFVGNIEDEQGFMHDGISGDTTQSVLERMDTILFADAYFLLIGTNDIALSPSPFITVLNIQTIAAKLHIKNPSAPIYINTLLPKNDFTNIRNQHVNLLLAVLATKNQLCNNCYLIDAGARFSHLPNWQQYIDSTQVRLTPQGYEVFTSLVMKSLNNIIVKHTL